MIDELKSKNSEELVSESIKKAKATNVEINSFVTIIDNPEHINNEESPLNGIPYAAKDLFSTKDILTTGSSNILANYVPFYDATVIKRLKDAVAIPIVEDSEDDKSLSIITAELSRAIQFGEGAENPACVTDLKNIAIDFNIDFNALNNGGFEDDDE